MDAVYDHLVTLLTGKFDVDAAEIRPEVSLGDLGLDSLAVVELFVTLQEHWEIPLEEGDPAAELTLRDVAQAVSRERSRARESEPGAGQ
jgi:acyl carrier protein